MIDISKKYKTRAGEDVRIYAVDGGGGSPIHGAVYTNDAWRIMLWDADGLRLGNMLPDLDLIEVKPRHKRTLWVNVYETTATVYGTREQADDDADSDRTACIKVELDFEEGEGL